MICSEFLELNRLHDKCVARGDGGWGRRGIDRFTCKLVTRFRS
jgi:hypothetical protein